MDGLMTTAAVLCWCAAVVVGGLGLFLLRPTEDPVRRILRTVAPTQLAAAALLAVAGSAAVVAPAGLGLVVVIGCVVGALGTVAAGCVHTAKMVAVAQARR